MERKQRVKRQEDRPDCQTAAQTADATNARTHARTHTTHAHNARTHARTQSREWLIWAFQSCFLVYFKLSSFSAVLLF